MSFNTERLSHAYITDGTFADTLAMAVVCGATNGERPCNSCVHCDKASRRIHPDIIVISKPDNKMIISVDQIRELKQDVYVVPNDAMKKAYVIKDADSMNTNAQNALLQILEEPPSHTVFILSTDNPSALLPTVYSRCVDLKSRSFEAIDAIDEESDDFEEIAGLADNFISALEGDNVKLMECMFQIDKLDRHSFNVFLITARGKLIEKLRENTSAGSLEISKAQINAESVLIKAGEMLDLNVSPGHISGFICASVMK